MPSSSPCQPRATPGPDLGPRATPGPDVGPRAIPGLDLFGPHSRSIDGDVVLVFHHADQQQCRQPRRLSVPARVQRPRRRPGGCGKTRAASRAVYVLRRLWVDRGLACSALFRDYFLPLPPPPSCARILCTRLAKSSVMCPATLVPPQRAGPLFGSTMRCVRRAWCDPL